MASQNENRKILVTHTAEEATDLVGELMKAVICDSVGRGGTCHMALSGGTTPHALYQHLARDIATIELPWQEVHVFFGDERDVPHDNVESNYFMARRTLLDHVPLLPGNVHPMPVNTGDLEAEAKEYERMIKQTVPAGTAGLPQFDLILLGMGADGHTASLFPCTGAIDEAKKLVVAHFVPVLGRNRMTFTFPLINAAKNVILLITGADKAAAVADLLGENIKSRRKLPVGRVSPSSGVLYMVLDADAAKLTGLKPV